MSNDKIQLYTSADGVTRLEIRIERDTLWLSQAQMAELFDKDSDTIGLHLKGIYQTGELDESATTEERSVVRTEGKRQVRRNIRFYNLDAIISVGYRVNSVKGTQFRIWATRVLQQHLVQGYTLNQRRLHERGIEFEQAISLLSRTLTQQQLVAPAGEAVLKVIGDYARSWSLLQSYDQQSLTNITQHQQNMYPLNYTDVISAVTELKRELIAKGEATSLFGQLRGNGLESAVATIEQSFGDTFLYPNIASRAAHLLYFVIKNHPLADGNKRTGSFLFLWYLQINQHLLAKPVERLINDNTLVALALLVAESQPDQKELMIRLVEHFVVLKSAE